MAKMKFDFMEPVGIGTGLFGANLLESDAMPDFYKDLNPTMKGAALVFAGSFVPKQKFAKKLIKNPSLRDGIGAGVQAEGIRLLMEEFGILSGISALKDDDVLLVALNADDFSDEDIPTINEDVLAEDMEDLLDEDIPTINEDVLGAEMYEDEEEGVYY